MIADSLPKGNAAAAKQSVVITGLGIPEFQAAARAVLEIHTFFGSTLPDTCLEPWHPVKGSEEGFMCLEFSNRYFSGGKDHDVALELGKDIDPEGILRAQCPEGIHTEDNRVLYFECYTTPETKYVCFPTPDLGDHV